MTEFFRGWTVNIVGLVIFIVLAEILIPSGKLKKYVSLITGIILVIALLNPLIKLAGRSIDLNDFELIESNVLSKEEIRSASKILEEEQMKQTVELYRKKLISQIEDASRSIAGSRKVAADVIINEDYSSQKFGEIRRIYLYIDEEKDTEVKPVAAVEKVDASKKDARSGDISKGVDPVLKRKLQEKLSTVLSVEKDIIIIEKEGV